MAKLRKKLRLATQPIRWITSLGQEHVIMRSHRDEV